jgi:hypothetical protein
MVRRYALALETITGISLQVDPVRGRLYPLQAVELLEAARAHLLAHPGGSIEAALRVVSDLPAGEVALPARVPGTITPDDLQTALRGVLGPVLAALEEQRARADALLSEVSALRAQLPSSEPDLAPVLASLQEQREQGAALGGEVGSLRAEVASLTAELQAARAAVERLEVMTHAALPSSPAAPVEPAPVPQAGAALGGLQVLARFLGLKLRSPGSRTE